MQKARYFRFTHRLIEFPNVLSFNELYMWPYMCSYLRPVSQVMVSIHSLYAGAKIFTFGLTLFATANMFTLLTPGQAVSRLEFVELTSYRRNKAPRLHETSSTPGQFGWALEVGRAVLSQGTDLSSVDDDHLLQGAKWLLVAIDRDSMKAQRHKDTWAGLRDLTRTPAATSVATPRKWEEIDKPPVLLTSSHQLREEKV